MVCDLWGIRGCEYVGLEVVDELRGVGSGAVVAAKHILGMSLVSFPPGLVVKFIDFAGAMIALVERSGYEAFGVLACAALLYALVPFCDDTVGNWLHGFFRLQARVQEP